MKKKLMALTGLAVVSGLALASCAKTEVVKGSMTNKEGYNYIEAPQAYEYDAIENKNVNVYLNYSGTAGVGYVSQASYTNPIDGVTYTQGTLLPTWVELGKVTGLDIKDVASYSDSSDDATYKTVSGKGFVTADGKGIDLFSNTVKNINTMGEDGNAIDLTQYINTENPASSKMPNFSQYLKENPTIKAQITKNGKIYYTPYFDGYNEIERMFVMDTSMVEALLDTDSFDNFDTSTSGKGSDGKTLKENNYEPFINPDYNYAADTTVTVSNNAKASTITIKKTTNIIKQQNELLAAGTTGKALAQQFKEYLKAAFGREVGKGKTYEKYSEIFTSEAAAYNCDELVALMRVVKANPKVVSGGLVESVECFFPRGEANNRVANILDLAQIWGIQGLDSESNNFFFDANGKLQSLGTTTASYQALELLNDLYNEGLIVNDFYYIPSSGKSGTKGLDKYFKKTVNNSSFGFLMYDYSAATGAANDTVQGVGTKPESRKLGTNLSVKGIRPVVSPLTYWATGTEWKYNQDIKDRTGMELTRYTESNRTLKTGSWCIPKTATNVDGAVRLMDVMFSEYGSYVNTFGPTEYWYNPTKMGDATKAWVATDISGSEVAPVLSNQLTAAIQQSGKDFWSFMRENIGATHGIGGLRNNQADFQATNMYAQTGLVNVKNAISSGAVKLAKVTADYGFGSSVLVNWSCTAPKVDGQNEAITSFWADKGGTSAVNWCSVVVNGTNGNVTTGTETNTAYTLAQVKSHIDQYAKRYLYVYANSLGFDHVADFCKS